MRELPKPGNETYIYVRESGEGATVNDALAQAMVRVFQSTANRLGQPFDSQKVKNALLSGTDYKIISQQYNIPVNRVGVYSTQIREGTYWVYVLCQVASMGNVTPVWDKVGMNSQTANWVALAKSTILPGWGQMGKDHFAEGSSLLNLEYPSIDLTKSRAISDFCFANALSYLRALILARNSA